MTDFERICEWVDVAVRSGLVNYGHGLWAGAKLLGRERIESLGDICPAGRPLDLWRQKPQIREFASALNARPKWWAGATEAAQARTADLARFSAECGVGDGDDRGYHGGFLSSDD